ncbi:MAG: lysophospholipid acyltransferase family protein, partial [Thermomicrobiales bacterium]
ARHYHHFWDGCVLLAILPRPMRATVTLDWVDSPRLHRLMTAANQAAGWTVTPRFDHQNRLPISEQAQLLAASRATIAALRDDELVLIFPEGYPTIDPKSTPKTRDDEMLPFKPGVLRFAALAERDGHTRAPIVPVGFEYRNGPRMGVTVRFGEAERPWSDQAAHVRHLEREVRRLSGLDAAPD